MRLNWNFFFIIGSLLLLIGAFQNCVVKEDSNGQLVAQEGLPLNFDKLNLSSELSGQTENNLEIDLVENKLNLEANYFNANNRKMENCKKSEEIDISLREEIISKYKKSSLCRSLVQADPEIVCTLEIKPETFFRVYRDSSLILDEKMGIQPCHSGEVSRFCEKESEFQALLVGLKDSMVESCQ